VSAAGAHAFLESAPLLECLLGRDPNGGSGSSGAGQLLATQGSAAS